MSERKRLPAAEVARYGFRNRQYDVIRICGDERGSTIEVQTDTTSITVWISAKGRSVRVYDKRGCELCTGMGKRAK